MENEINLSKQQINSLLGGLLKGDSTPQSAEEVKKALTTEQSEKLQSIMSDPAKIKAILTSPEAKKLFEIIKNKRE